MKRKADEPIVEVDDDAAYEFDGPPPESLAAKLWQEAAQFGVKSVYEFLAAEKGRMYLSKNDETATYTITSSAGYVHVHRDLEALLRDDTLMDEEGTKQLAALLHKIADDLI